MSEEDDKAQSQNLEIREGLNNAYAALDGQRATATFATYSIENALDEQIERIEGADTPLRPNEIHRVDRIEANVLAAVAKIKAMPDNAFREPDNNRDVNTKP